MKNIQSSVYFKDLTTFRVGGKIEHFYILESEQEIPEVVKLSKKIKLPIFVLGGGSDILVSDKKFKGIVIKLDLKNIKVTKKTKESVFIECESGYDWDDFVKFTTDKGLWGAELLSAIPGTVGASPIQNIGAYGAEIENIFENLTAYDVLKEEFRLFSKKDCKFSYRESIFKKDKYKNRFIITRITFKLKKKLKFNTKDSYKSLKEEIIKKGYYKPTSKQIRKLVIKIREKNLENVNKVPNAGSFFKNPVIDERLLNKIKIKYPDIPNYKIGNNRYKLFAGWLIDKSGLKGKKYKGAMVSEKHALVIINPESLATANDIKKLSEIIKKSVYEKFDIKLEPEVRFVNF